MKKYALTLFATLFFLSSCNKTEKFTVTLNLENADNQTVYLCKQLDSKDTVLDTAVFTGGQAILEAGYDDPQSLYIIKFNPDDQCNIFPFFSENQNITISGNKDDMPHWTANGCPTLDTLMAFHKQSLIDFEDPIMALYDDMATTFESGDTAKCAEINMQLQPLIEAYFNNMVEFIKAHSDNYLGHYMLNEMKTTLEPSIVKELFNGLTNESRFSKQVREFIDNQQ